MKKGVFITFEGIEGMGKSTAIAFLHRYLLEQGVDCLMTREPGGTEIAETIRGVLLKKHTETMQNDTELLLFFAGRAQHLETLIKPALVRGQWVLCDRFTDATYAYQGYGRGFSVERIAALEAWVQKGLQPTLTLLLDAPVDVGLERIGKRGGPGDRIEQEKKAFFERARKGYLDRAAQLPERFKIVDASLSTTEVEQQLKDIIADYL